MADSVPTMFREYDSKHHSNRQLVVSPGACKNQSKGKKPSGKGSRRFSSFDRLFQDTDKTQDDTSASTDEENSYSSWERQLRYILCKKLDADLELTNASHNLRPASSKLSDMHLEINHAVSKMRGLMKTLDQITKERDELKSTLEDLKREHSVSDDVETLKASIVKIQALIEELSAHFLKFLEENFYSSILPVWNHAPEAFKEQYIRSVLSQRMLMGFESENFLVNEDSLPALDLEDLRKESLKKIQELSNKKVADLKNEDSMFNKFVSEKRSGILKELRKSMLVGSVDVSRVLHKNTEEMFDNLAKEVWTMHKLALSNSRKVRILRVQKGATFDERWMKSESVSPDVHEQAPHKNKVIQFMVIPGFQIEDILVSPCRAYII